MPVSPSAQFLQDTTVIPIEDMRQSLGLPPATSGVIPIEEMRQSLGLSIPEPTRETGVLGTFGRAVGQGVQGEIAALQALGGTAAQLFGFDDTANDLFKLAEQRSAAIPLPPVEFTEAGDSIGNFSLWAAQVLGENVPFMATILLGGGIGGVVAKLASRGALTAVEANLAMVRFGQKVGAVTAAASVEGGGTALESFAATGEVNPAVVGAAGLAKGLLEVVVPIAFARQFGLFGGQSASFLAKVTDKLAGVTSRPARALALAAAGGATEGATEFLQEAIDLAARDFVDENFDALGSEGAERFLESAATGAFVGFFLGGLAGGITRPESPPTGPLAQVPPTEPPSLTGPEPLLAFPAPALVTPPGLAAEPSGPVIIPPNQPLGVPFAVEQKDIDPEPVEESAPSEPAEPGVPKTAPEVLDLELNAAGARFVASDKPFERDVQAPATAALVASPTGRPLTAREKKSMKRIEDLYTKALRKLGVKDTKIILYDDQLSFGMGVGPDNRGVYHPFKGDTHVIGVDIKNLTAPEQRSTQLMKSAGHEFGHFIGYTELTKAPEGVRERLQSAYNRERVRRSLGGAGVFQPPLLSSSAEYWLGFDEFFAENVAEWMTSSARSPIDSVERFFQVIAKKVKKVLAFMQGKQAAMFLPAPEVQEYLESIFSRKNNFNPLSITYTAYSVGKDEADREDHTSGATTDRIISLFDKIDLPPKTMKKAKKIIAAQAKFNWVMKIGWNVLQIADKNKDIAWIQSYVGWLEKWSNRKAGIHARADQTLREWRRVVKNQQEAFAQFVWDIDQMRFLSTVEKARGVVRQPTDAELITLIEKHQLRQEAFDLYLRIRGDFNFMLDSIEALLRRDAEKSLVAKDSEGLAAAMARITQEFKRLRRRPYFPHSRFGDFALVIKNRAGETVFMEQFITEREAKSALKLAGRDFPKKDGFRMGVDLIPETVRGFSGLPSSLLKSIEERLELTEEQQTWLRRMVVEMAPAQSFKKRLERRKNIPGFSIDAMRSYSSYFWHSANYIARVEFGPEMEDTINTAKKETSALLGATDVVKRRRLIAYIEDHKDHVMNPGEDWAWARSVAFQWWLGFSPASAVLNFTQIPMVAYPYLASRYNDPKALSALKNAMLEVKNLYQAPVKQGKKMSDDDFRQVQVGIEQEFLEESMAVELAGQVEGGNLVRAMAGNKYSRWYQSLTKASGYMFQTSEKINRRVVFMAGVRLARANPDAAYLQELKTTKPGEFADLVKRGMSENEAVAFMSGKDAVRRTQFEYAAWARPVFMRGRKGLIFTFFMFVQNMTWFTLNSPGNVRFLLMMLAMGGLMGLPGSEDLVAVAKFIARQLNVDFDPEREVRRFVVNLTDDDSEIPPDLFLYGASRVGFGLPAAADAIGIPFPMFDMSRNISMGQIIPGVAEFGPPGGDFNSRFSRVGTDIAGASLGIGINLFKALTDSSLPVDDFKRWERAFPRALRNVTKAIRIGVEGEERGRDLGQVVPFDPFEIGEFLELAAQAGGFTPTRLSREYDRRAMLREAGNYLLARRALIFRQFDYATEMRDAEAVRDVRAAARRFNRDAPRGLRITGGDLVKSRRGRRRRRRLVERGLPAQRQLHGLGREVNELFPEVESEKVPSGG